TAITLVLLVPMVAFSLTPPLQAVEITNTSSNVEGDKLVVAAHIRNTLLDDIYSATVQVDSQLGSKSEVVDLEAGKTKIVNFNFQKPAEGEYTFTVILLTSRGNDQQTFKVAIKENGTGPPIPESPLYIGVAIVIVIVAGALFLYPFFHARKRPFATERGREQLLTGERKRRKKLF
ncbi:hypothetical protein HYS54_01140, partial [Candidatus Micrarchaeota archaeon]|nr:hypothetical protein [Candidatus Micrarchaeota archaeon]